LVELTTLLIPLNDGEMKSRDVRMDRT